MNDQKSEKNMISTKDAVKKSLEYLNEVVGEIDKPKNIMLEGIRKTNNGEWIINISYERDNGDNQANSIDILLGRSSRLYKEIRLDAEGNGQSFETSKLPQA